MTRPTIQTKNSAGADLTAQYDYSILPGSCSAISTGYMYDLETAALVVGRSGLAFNKGILCHIGLIDPDYRSEVKVLLYNTGHEIFQVKAGDRIAQIIAIPSLTRLVYPVLGQTRSGGFGSTDAKD